MRRSKRIAIRVHLWLGLTVGLLWSIQGLTGAALVFHRELDRWAHPEWRGSSGPPLPVDRLVTIAERHAGHPVSAIGILDGGRDLRTATFTGDHGTQRMLLLDASNGGVVGERLPQPNAPSRSSTSRFIHMIHEKLAAGDAGEVIIGTSGCLLLSSAILGLWIGWPRRGNWRALVTPRSWRTFPQKLFSWHRLAGLLFGSVFVVVATGGIYMTFTDSIRSGLGKFLQLQGPYSGAAFAQNGEWRPAQEALGIAERLFPGAEFVRVAMPAGAKPYYIVRLRQAGEVRAWSGATTVTVHAQTGKVLQVQDGLRGPVADRILDAQFSIHNGEIGGLPGRMLIMLAGLSLPTFYGTGIWLWFRKRRLRRGRNDPQVRAGQRGQI